MVIWELRKIISDIINNPNQHIDKASISNANQIEHNIEQQSYIFETQEPIEEETDTEDIHDIEPIEEETDIEDIHDIEPSEEETDTQDILDIEPIEEETDAEDIHDIEPSEEEFNYEDLANNEKIELLKEIKKILEEEKNKSVKEKLEDDLRYKHRERRLLCNRKNASSKSDEIEFDIGNANIELINELSKIPSFDNYTPSFGYSFDLTQVPDVSDIIINNLINKFINQRFKKSNGNLNVRGTSLEKKAGFYKWDTVPLTVHMKTKQFNRVLSDKYDYDYESNNEEKIPLSFYFDLSGSMSNYSSTLASIALQLLKHDVVVLIGYNERVTYQIEKVDKNVSVEELTDIIYKMSQLNQEKVFERVKFKYVNRNIDNYLIESSAEKCVVFTDFDALSYIINLSNSCDVYWFNFKKYYSFSQIQAFNGFVYDVQCLQDIADGLKKINSNNFRTLAYLSNSKRRNI